MRWPVEAAPTTFDALAQELSQEDDVLAIVHLRKDARELCERLDQLRGDKNTEHLSALLCAEHRSQILGRVRERKRLDEPVRLVATQLVEAGVDLDFRVVYRAFGGLDARAGSGALQSRRSPRER